MWSLRTLVAAALLVAMATLAACGGSPGGSTAATSTPGGEASTGGEPSDAPDATASPSEGGGPGGETGDLESLIDDLVPPNSNETSRFDVAGGVTVSYDSSTSVADLRTFYEGKISDHGWQMIQSGEAEGNVSLIFGDDGTNFGGSVAIGTGGSSGSVVIVTLADPEG